MHSTLKTELDDAQILRNMADHLRDLSEEVAQLSTTVSDVTALISPPPSVAIIQSLQRIDALQQSLADLAQLSEAMASQTPTRSAAIQDLKLEATRALLSGNDIAIIPRSGLVDLF